MREVIDRTPTSYTEIVRSDHDENGSHFFNTVINNDAVVERNKRIRLNGDVQRGQKMPLRDGEVILYALEINPMEWAFFKRDYPDLYSGMKSKDEAIRMAATRNALLMNPHWSKMAGNR